MRHLSAWPESSHLAARTETKTSLIFRKDRQFDWEQSTEENHRSLGTTSYGNFQCIREQLDYSFHSNYSFARQMLQDSIIESFIPSNPSEPIKSSNPEPWIIFTAGAMGAGKSYTIRRLHKQGKLPMKSHVTVDPDEIRRCLPEFDGYLKSAPDRAGELTRKEAGMMAEILTKAALERGENVLVDGSLRDAEWYQNYFEVLRGSYPHIKIGIIHVTAPLQAVLERATHRALITGRIVPEKVIRETIEQVPISVQLLRPEVDFYLEINNS